MSLQEKARAFLKAHEDGQDYLCNLVLLALWARYGISRKDAIPMIRELAQ